MVAAWFLVKKPRRMAETEEVCFKVACQRVKETPVFNRQRKKELNLFTISKSTCFGAMLRYPSAAAITSFRSIYDGRLC